MPQSHVSRILDLIRGTHHLGSTHGCYHDARMARDAARKIKDRPAATKFIAVKKALKNYRVAVRLDGEAIFIRNLDTQTEIKL